MKLYLAAVYTNRLEIGGKYYASLDEREKTARLNVRHILESYHYVHKKEMVENMRRDGCKVFLDSGAFSAYTQGVEINLDAYCQYIHSNKDIIEVCSVLDGIGNALKTYQNQDAMESLGVRPLPCFHFGEDARYLIHYMDNYEYITLGGMVPYSTKDQKIWLDEIWSKYLCKPDGTARIKVHGFGLTAIELLSRYPWYSVDSSSWVAYGNYGNVVFEKYGVLGISKDKATRKEANKHFDSLLPTYKKAIENEIQTRGFNIERLREQYVSRWAFNMHAYYEINDDVLNKTVVFQQDQIPIF